MDMDSDISLVITAGAAILAIIAVAFATLWAIYTIIVAIWLYKGEAIYMLIAGGIIGAWVDTILWLHLRKS